ncbi:MAG: YaiI/YqxD family protein [Longimicrobiales bacterium]|nr:YaiI/YqxD family protein [Longimicrobiales bacterium]
MTKNRPHLPEEETEGGDREMTIWVDADAVPSDVKDVVFRASKRRSIRLVMVANHRISIPANNPLATSILVQPGPDVADHHIATEARAGDLAVTADIPLAAALVEKGLEVLDPRGDRYSATNVRERLSIRDFMESLRSSGVQTGGPSAYGPSDKRAFANALDRTLTRKLKGR